MKKFVVLIFTVAVLAILATSIISSGGIDKFLEKVRLAVVTGELQIGSEAPEVRAIFLQHFVPSTVVTNCTETYTDCWTDPLTGGTRYPQMIVMVRDGNGCSNDALFDVFVHVCTPGVSPCTEINANTVVELNWLETNPSDAAFCNYSASLVPFQYYLTPSTDVASRYEFYVNATDDDGTTWNTNDAYNVYFQYAVLVDFLYPGPGSGDTIRLGTLSLGQWNNGTGDTAPTDPNAWNRGNVEQDVLWRADDYCTDYPGCAADVLQITGTNYAIDDDQDGSTDAGNLEQRYIDDIPTNDIEFPATNLQICSNLACNGAGDDDARFDIYWHMFVPSAQATGTYQNSITITNSQV